jgi:hypothetical protein
MSYCRKEPGVSDVYVYTDGEQIICSDCSLTELPPHREPPYGDGIAKHIERTAAGMLRHLLGAHIAAGHLVPAAAIERLRREDRS